MNFAAKQTTKKKSSISLEVKEKSLISALGVRHPAILGRKKKPKPVQKTVLFKR